VSEYEHKSRGHDVAHAASHQRSEPMPTRGQQVEETLRDLASWIDRVRTALEAVDQPPAATDREASHARLVRLIRRADDSLARARARVQALASPDAAERLEEAAATLAKYKAEAPPVTVAETPEGSDALHVFSPERSAFARLTSRRPAPPPSVPQGRRGPARQLRRVARRRRGPARR
jgi:hypothetical protein